MHAICVMFLLLLIKLHHSLGRECVIEGIPGVSASDDSNIHTILVPSGETSITLELTCKCSLYVPQWHIQALEEESSQFFTHPIHCINGTRPCSHTYIPRNKKSQGLFVYLRNNFTITESTALMCFSNIDRDALIVSFPKDDEGSSTVIQSVLTTTVTETKTITRSLTATSTIIRTGTTSMCSSSNNKPIRATSQDNTPSTSITGASSQANTIDATNSAAVTQTPIIGGTKGIMESVGGPTSVVLIVLVLMLIVIIIGLCGVIICMKTRNKQRETVVQEISSESNSADSNRLSDIPLLWRNSNASEIGELAATHMPRSFSTPLKSLSTSYNTNTNNNKDDFRITMHYMTDTSSPANQPVSGDDDEIFPNPDAENV